MKTTFIISLFFIFTLGNYSVFAQDSTNIITIDSKTYNPFEGNYIKFSPFTLLEIEPSILLGYEYNATPKIRIQHEIGYVALFNPAYALFQWETNFNNLSSSGVKLRTTIKFPLKLDNMNVRHKHKYLGIDFMFKYLGVTEKEVSIRRMNAYWELMDIKTEKYIGTVHLVYGINEYVSNANNIIMDSYFGIGVRYKYITDNSPEDVSYNNRPWWDEMEGLMISCMMGFKFGFGL